MTALLFSCQVCRKWSLRSHIPIRKFHHVRHSSSSPWSSSVTASLFKMAAVTVLTARRDVTANWSFICLLSASAPTVTFGERSSDGLDTVLASSGDLPDSIGTNSPRTRPTSCFGGIQGTRLVCLLPSSSFSKIPLSVKAIRSSRHLLHELCGH